MGYGGIGEFILSFLFWVGVKGDGGMGFENRRRRRFGGRKEC